MLRNANTTLLLARTAARLNRVELGRKIGRSSRWVQRVELGDGCAKLTPAIKEKIASAVGSSVQILFPEFENHEVDQGGAE